MMNLGTKPADYVIILLAIILLSGLYWHYWVNKANLADYVIISTPNNALLRLNLQHNQSIKVRGFLGESVLEITNGRIRFISSPCQGKHCIHAGWLAARGDFAACVPNQVSITLYGVETAGFDAIVY